MTRISISRPATDPAVLAAKAPISTTTIDLTDRTDNTSERVPAGFTTNCATAGVTKTAPVLAATVGTPPLRWAVRNVSTGIISLSYPNESGTATTLTMLSGETLTFRQKSTNGWGVESGNKPLAGNDARYSGNYGLGVGRGPMIVPISCNNVVGNFQSSGTETSASYRAFYPITDPACLDVLPVFTNQPNFGPIGDQQAPNDITIAAAVELSDGTVVPFTFNGQHTVTIPKGGGLAIPDHPLSIGAQVTDAQWNLPGVYVRTYVTVAASRVDTAGTTSGSATVTDTSITAADFGRAVTGTGIPSNSFVGTVTPGTSFLLSSKPNTQTNVNATVTNAAASLTIGSYWPLNCATVSFGVKKNATGDLTLEQSAAGSGGFGGSNANSYGPALLLGRPATRKPIVVSLTDSIFHGTTDAQAGPVHRAAASLGYPHVKMSKVAEAVAGLITPSGRRYRSHLLRGATHGILELGTNDGVDTLAKATTLQTNMTTLLNYLNTYGIKWWVVTVPPKGTSSTDGYATTAGQTANSLAAAQAQMNTWIRGGCGGLAAGFIEMSDVVASARDSGLWAPHPTRGRHLTDLATTSGSNVVTSASAAFTAADVGLGIYVNGVYTGSNAIISSVVSGTQVTVTNGSVGGAALNAGATVSAAVGGVGSYYATADGTHPSAAMMLGGILTNVQAAMAGWTV